MSLQKNMQTVEKSLLIPINSQRQILIQDRRNYKRPDWGFFGGTIEKGETPLQAVVREAKEELALHLQEKDIHYIGKSKTFWQDGVEQIRHVFIYKTEQKEFIDHEGKGAHWLSFEEADMKLEIQDRFKEIIKKLKPLY